MSTTRKHVVEIMLDAEEKRIREYYHPIGMSRERRRSKEGRALKQKADADVKALRKQYEHYLKDKVTVTPPLTPTQTSMVDDVVDNLNKLREEENGTGTASVFATPVAS